MLILIESSNFAISPLSLFQVSIGTAKERRLPSGQAKEPFKCGMLLKVVELTNTVAILPVSAQWLGEIVFWQVGLATEASK
jgi:hypothetical protein